MIAQDKFNYVMREFRAGRLTSYGKVIKNEKQAFAIAKSEARKVDKQHNIKKYAHGNKIDNLTQLVFNEAWKAYESTGGKTADGFDKWLITTPEGRLFYKRIAEINRSEPYHTTTIYSGDGMKLRGKTHEQGGIAGIYKNQPIEVEDGEQIIKKESGRIREHIKCEGTGFGIGSALNELTHGTKWSDEGHCEITTNKMKKGNKIKTHINENKIQRMIIRDDKLKQQAEQGMKYQEGNKIEQQFIKINEPKEFAIVEFLNDADYQKHTPALKVNDICIYSADELNTGFLDEHGIHYTIFESRNELNEWLKNQLPQRIKNKL